MSIGVPALGAAHAPMHLPACVAVSRPSRPLPRFALPAAAIVLAVAGIAGMLARGAPPHDARSPSPGRGAAAMPLPTGPVRDPFTWSPRNERSLVTRAARGTSHGIFALSPGGVDASAARTARYRGLIDAAARTAGVPPATLEGLVLLESAGRTDAVTPAGLSGAVGLTQILAQTGSGLLGMKVDAAASQRISDRIARATDAGDRARVQELVRRRAQVDQRFDARASLEATGRYLADARRRFGRTDLAIASYHMGQGNLESVLRAYSGEHSGAIADVVRRDGLSYARVYFDSSPTHHAEAWRQLSGLGDDSSNYLWKVYAAQAIMSRWRTDRPGLARLAARHAASDTGEQALHPIPGTPRFANPGALRAALADGGLVTLPDRPRRTGLRIAPQLAPLYRGLRPEAAAVALYLGERVRAQVPGTSLEVTAAARDVQAGATGREGVSPTLMHQTGWAFDIARTYSSQTQALALQFALDRLSVLGAIAWQREGRQIHVTAGPERELLGLLRGVAVSRP
jgi:soluble lytic murein transglycosylase-like protein